jgi:hypothetical protein
MSDTAQLLPAYKREERDELPKTSRTSSRFSIDAREVRRPETVLSAALTALGI